MTTYDHDSADRMTRAGAVSYLYDDNGNQTTRGTDTQTLAKESGR